MSGQEPDDCSTAAGPVVRPMRRGALSRILPA